MKLKRYVPREYEKREKPGRARKYPFPWMEVGEYFSLEEPNATLKLRAAVDTFKHNKGLSEETREERAHMKFSILTKEGNIALCIRVA